MADSEDELLLLSYVCHRRNLIQQRKRRRFWVHTIIEQREKLGEYHRLVQELKLDSSRFTAYFRMTPTMFEDLLSLIAPIIKKKNTNYRKAIEPEQRLAITIRYVDSHI